MKLSILICVLITPIVLNAQNLRISVGNTVSSIDWKYVYFDGSYEPFYTGTTANNCSIDIDVEYLETKIYSLSTYASFYQSGGKIAADESHDNWLISETENRANNFAVGTDLNIFPINNKFQLAIAFGPRVDYLMPFKGSSMSALDSITKVYFGISSGLGLYYQFDNIKIGLRSTFIHRFSDYIDQPPYFSQNWGEPSKLGVRAQDRFIIKNQIVLGIRL